MQVMLLADRLQAPACFKCAAAVLTANTMEHGTAMAVSSLPPGCLESPAFKRVIDAAASVVCARLGDLEVALADASMRQELLDLSLSALQRLLQHKDTRAASENTVFWLADAWLAQRGGGGEQEQAALAGCISLLNASSLYLQTVMCQSEWLQRHRSDLQLAAAYVAAPPDVQKRILLSKWQPVRIAKRPASPCKEGDAGMGHVAGGHQAGV